MMNSELFSLLFYQIFSLTLTFLLRAWRLKARSFANIPFDVTFAVCFPAEACTAVRTSKGINLQVSTDMITHVRSLPDAIAIAEQATQNLVVAVRGRIVHSMSLEVLGVRL